MIKYTRFHRKPDRPQVIHQNHVGVDFLQQLKCDYKEYPTFIETGTYLGETTFAVEPLFQYIHTIEIKEEFYNNVKSKYSGDKIHFHLGDSTDVFETILPTINEKTIFFLDGHWSAGDTGRGVKDCPLIEELNLIMRLFKSEAVIIIDDHRLFGKGPNTQTDPCNWEDISDDAVLNTVASRMSTYYFLGTSRDPNDRMIIHLNAI